MRVCRLLQQLFHCLDSTFGLTVALSKKGTAGDVTEVVGLGKLCELRRVVLRAIVADKYTLELDRLDHH